MYKKFIDLLDFIGANKKIEFIKIIVINLLIIIAAVVAFIFLKNIMIVFASLLMLVVSNYLLFSAFTSRKKTIINNRDQEFITLIGYFRFFITNSYNVYQAFKALVPYGSSYLSEQIDTFLQEIDHDKSVKPFISFADKFSIGIAKNIMLAIYHMVDEGEDDVHMIQFESLFSEINKNQQKDLIDNQDKRMSSLSSLPLIGAGSLTVLITFAIIHLMGEMINVL